MAKGLLKRLEGRASVPQGLTTLAMHARLIGLTPSEAAVAVHHKHGIRRGLRSVNRLGLRGVRVAFYDAAYEADRADYTPETRAVLREAEQAYSRSLQVAEPRGVFSHEVSGLRRGKSVAGDMSHG